MTSLLRLEEDRLPDHLCLCKTEVISENGDSKLATSRYGFKIAGNAGAEPLLVGFRYGSRLRNKIRHLSLCLGAKWYGSSNGPFLKASHDRKKSFTITYRSEYPNIDGKCVRVITTRRSKLGTTFEMVVPDLATNAPTLERFEWRHRKDFRFRGKKPEFGNVLVLASATQPQQIVAYMEWGEGRLHRAMTRDFHIDFTGAGSALGGAWKVVAFIIGILTFR